MRGIFYSNVEIHLDWLNTNTLFQNGAVFQCCENYSKKVISKNYNYFSEKVIITITNYFFPKVINY